MKDHRERGFEGALEAEVELGTGCGDRGEGGALYESNAAPCELRLAGGSPPYTLNGVMCESWLKG